MAIVARAAAKGGICSTETKDNIIATIQLFGLPTATDYNAEALYTSALSDKKRSGGTVSLIVPVGIGDCHIVPTPVTELKSFIEAGL
jgi:3-dehydroquinate synthase